MPRDRSTLEYCARRARLDESALVRFFEVVLEEVAMGREVELRGLGTVRMTRINGHAFDNPNIPGGATVVLPRNVIRFRASAKAKHAVNQDQ